MVATLGIVSSAVHIVVAGGITRTVKHAALLRGVGALATTVSGISLTAGRLLVVKIGWSLNGGTFDIVPTATGFTFTKRISSVRTDTYAAASIWTATVPTTGTHSVIFTPGGSCFWYADELVEMAGAQTASFGGTGKVDGLGSVTNGASSLTLSAAPATTSYVEAVCAVDNTGGTTSVAPGATFTESSDVGGGEGTLQSQYRTGSASTTVNWADVHVSGAGTVYSHAACALEILD